MKIASLTAAVLFAGSATFAMPTTAIEASGDAETVIVVADTGSKGGQDSGSKGGQDSGSKGGQDTGSKGGQDSGSKGGNG